MKSILLSLVIISVVLLIVYAMWGRAWLKKQPWTQGFFASIEPLEVALFKKSETILMGRLLWVGGLFVSLYDGIALWAHNLDLTPLTTRIMDILHIPADLRGLTVSGTAVAIGLMINNLRAKITKPLELVAVPDSKVTTDQAAAIEKADAVTAEAVQSVKAG